MAHPSRPAMSAEQYNALTRRLALEYRPAPPQDVLAALSCIRHGRIVSLGDGPAEPPLDPGLVAPVGEPAPYRLTQWTESGDDWVAVNDRLELDVHGATSMTHLDTTGHFTWRNGRDRPPKGDPLVELANAPIVRRGVLVDVPGVLGLEVGGMVVTLEEVQEVLERTGLVIHPGDVLHISLGRRGTARSDIAFGAVPTAGLSIEAAEWLAGLSPAAIVTDEGLDPLPSQVDGLPVPWHVLVLTVLEIPLIDRALLTTLSRACAELSQWEFLSVLAPLPIRGASGSPLNPLAIL